MTDLEQEQYWSHLLADDPDEPPGGSYTAANGRTHAHRHNAGATWRPVDLEPILDGTRARPEPTILRRTDGQGLIYPGLTHALVGESESAKSWIAQYACAQQLLAKNAVVYLDFEDSAGSVTDRMTTLGMNPEMLTSRFAYIAPEEPVEPAGRSQLAQAMADLHPSLVILDGVTEAMALHSLKSNDNDDLATFGRLIARPLAGGGAAVVTLDHQPKSSENRGRYALGGVHKLNALSGASLIAESVAPFGAGLRGITRLRIAKDRPGQLREHGLHSEGGLRWIGDFILDTRDLVEPAFIQPPTEAKKAAEEWRPTELMESICAAMQKAKRPLSKTEIRSRVKGRNEIVQRALAILVDEDYLKEEPGPRGVIQHVIVKEYSADADDRVYPPPDPPDPHFADEPEW